MQQKNYIGHPSQIMGVEEYRLMHGKGDHMHMLHIRNGLGMELVINADRCADISRLCLDGKNLSYTSVAGEVAPSYYTLGQDGFGFLKSFNCGFLTTCGFNNIGSPNEDEGKMHGLHGNIGNTPSDYIYHTENDKQIEVHALIKDHEIFGAKFTLKRVFTISKISNQIILKDNILNEGSKTEPLMYLYHINLGYPLLDEHAEIYVNSTHVSPRDETSKKGLSSWNQILPPTPNFSEQCFYHTYNTDTANMMVYNTKIEKGIQIQFPTCQFPQSIQWKMMGERDYVLGLEPCTASLDGRHQVKNSGNILSLAPGESKEFSVTVNLFTNKAQWESYL